MRLDLTAMTADDLVAFWSKLDVSDTETKKLHPDDKLALSGEDLSNEFELSLCPKPWAGPIKSAQVFLLYLNPCLDPTDTIYEKENQALQETIKKNLLGSERYFYLLDEFREHSGYKWAKRKLGKDIMESNLEKFCTLQLFPYHSRKGGTARKLFKITPSSKKMIQFINNSLSPRAESGEIGIIAVRGNYAWCLNESKKNHIVYRGTECIRGAVTATSRGGHLFRSFLEKTEL